MKNQYNDLSDLTGIAVPEVLQKFLASGKTQYGAQWAQNWRERMLTDPPLFSCVYDFEWITAKEAQEAIEEWLNPVDQNGQRFLPFAQTGAGDKYCLIPLSQGADTGIGEIGVALIMHDSEDQEITYANFSDFVCAKVLEAFADLSHLERDFSKAEIAHIVQADVQHIASLMSDEHAQYLRAFLARDAKTFLPINQDELQTEQSKFKMATPISINVIACWDLG